MSFVTLRSSDGEEKKISKENCEISTYLKKQIDEGKDVIELEDVKSNLLTPIIDYLNHYSENDYSKLPEVLSSNDLKKQIDDFDFNLIDSLSYEDTFHLINAGLLLDLEHLHDLACVKIAAFMKGKTPEEVNKEFTIECQLTQEEAKQLGLDAN